MSRAGVGFLSAMLAAAGIVWASSEAVREATFATPARSTGISIAVIGDTAYTPEREVQLDNLLADIDRHELSFVVHVGDLGSPRQGSCTDALLAKRLGQFSASANPLVYTPGDNDWTDCRDMQSGSAGFPLERLSKVRETFYPATAVSLGKRTIPLVRQSDGSDTKFAKYKENARWDMGGITFMTLHVVGSNNGLGRTAESDGEFADRLAADLAWLESAFAHATASGSRAVMIFQQANIFPAYLPFPGDPKQQPSGYGELRAALARHALAFGKPVGLVHGDSHFFRVDKPYLRRGANDDTFVPNLTRIEGFGDPFHHWVRIDVDSNDPEVFVVRPRLVGANR